MLQLRKTSDSETKAKLRTIFTFLCRLFTPLFFSSSKTKTLSRLVSISGQKSCCSTWCSPCRSAELLLLILYMKRFSVAFVFGVWVFWILHHSCICSVFPVDVFVLAFCSTFWIFKCVFESASSLKLQPVSPNGDACLPLSATVLMRPVEC